MLVWEYIKSLFGQWWPLMSCAAFTLLAIWAGLRNKPTEWLTKGSLVLALFFFFIGSYFAWKKEHSKVADLTAKLLIYDSPQLQMQPQVLGGNVHNGQLIIVRGTLYNNGSPTVIGECQIDLRMEDGTLFHGKMIGPATETLVIPYRPGANLVFAPNENWSLNATEVPIPTGGGRRGWIAAFFTEPFITAQYLMQHHATAILTMHDSRGKPWTFTRALSESELHQMLGMGELFPLVQSGEPTKK
ncbi:MAG TPA: hypothetical protein VMD58_04965 [Acidobacteriaceae bacterium]|nr:hypothetical protein [Acidobacteriaceae bacterium]